MKIAIIILLVVLNLAVAGGAAFYFMSKGDAAAATEGEGVAQEGEHVDEEGASDEMGSKKKSKKEAVFEALEPAFVVNFEHRGAVRFLQVKVEVMSRDQSVIDDVNSLEPMIRDSLLMILSASNYESVSDSEGKQLLRDEVRSAINDILKGETGRTGIEEVYFTKFVMQ